MTIAIERPVPNVFAAGLPSLDYQAARTPEEAHALIARARRQAPIAMGPYGPELLTYELVRSALRDSTFRVPQGFTLAAQGITSGPLWDRTASNLLSLDGAEHHRLRRLVSKAFTPKAAERLRTTAVDVINELVDPLAAVGRCDLVADVATQYPIPIICALLGAPREDWELFSGWADDVLKAFFWNAANDAPIILRAWDELDAYVDGMVAERRHTLTDDLISDLIRAEDDGDRLTHDELLMLVSGLLIAGTDTTRNQLAASAHVLHEHPDQWALLAEHPELAPKAVEETMRHSPIAFATMRTPVEDVELGGVYHPGGHAGARQLRRGQSRSRRLRRSRPPRHHPRVPAGHADLRRRDALLPRSPPRQNRTRRGPDGHHAADAQPPPHRARALETTDRDERPGVDADRIRRWTLTNGLRLPSNGHDLDFVMGVTFVTNGYIVD